MTMRRVFCTILFAVGYLGSMEAQEAPTPQLSPGSARKPAPAFRLPTTPSSPQSVKLSVPKGTPLQVALDEEICVKRVGQPIHAIVVEPVYAFDRLVVPVGSQVTGKVTKIEAISGGKRTIAALDADFTPERKVEVSFNDLALPDGRHFQLQTSVSPGSGQVIRFVAAAESKERKGVKDAASERTRQAKEQAKQEWDKAMKQLRTPGRVHRLKRYVEAQLPVHAQYIPVGTVYFRGAQCAFGFRHRDDDAADGLFDRRPAAAGQRGTRAARYTSNICNLAEGRSGGGSHIRAAPGWRSRADPSSRQPTLGHG
jgi:hypothetical protein